jgi:hypothetical protein
VITRLQVTKMLGYISLHLELLRRTVPLYWKERRQCDEVILERVTLGARTREFHTEDAFKSLEERDILVLFRRGVRSALRYSKIGSLGSVRY